MFECIYTKKTTIQVYFFTQTETTAFLKTF